MEKATIYNATQRWLKNGDIKIVEKVALNKLKANEWFIKDKMLCKVKTSSVPFCSYIDNVLNEHATTNTSQKVDKVVWNI